MAIIYGTHKRKIAHRSHGKWSTTDFMGFPTIRVGFLESRCKIITLQQISYGVQLSTYWQQPSRRCHKVVLGCYLDDMRFIFPGSFRHLFWVCYRLVALRDGLTTKISGSHRDHHPRSLIPLQGIPPFWWCLSRQGKLGCWWDMRTYTIIFWWENPLITFFKYPVMCFSKFYTLWFDLRLLNEQKTRIFGFA